MLPAVFKILLLFQTTINGWWLTAYGSGHVLLTANHNMVERFDAAGYSNGHPIDNWYPWFCYIHHIEGGDAAGTPLRIYLAPPNGYGVSCYAGLNGSATAGWHTNTGHYEGQQKVYSPAWVENWFVPGRDPASPSAYGSVIKVG